MTCTLIQKDTTAQRVKQHFTVSVKVPVSNLLVVPRKVSHI